VGLFGGKMSIGLTVDSEGYLPGQSIAAHVDVGGDGDGKLRALRVELRYHNTYYHETSSSSDSGGRDETKTSDDVVVVTEQVPVEDLSAPAGSAGFDFTLTIPEDVPPTAPKWVDWSVAAILDRRRARDRRESVPITILAPATGYALWATAPQSCDEDVCDMQLDLDARAVRIGGTLTGTLRIDPRREFDARRVRVALEGRMHHEDGIKRKADEAKVTVAERTKFVPGFGQEFPFTLTAPDGALPTFLAEHNQLRWTLRGICDRSLRGDHDVSAEIVVYTAP
jgi:hypothetical protein